MEAVETRNEYVHRADLGGRGRNEEEEVKHSYYLAKEEGVAENETPLLGMMSGALELTCSRTVIPETMSLGR